MKDVLDYNSETGEFKYLKANCNNVKVGNIAGTLRKDGYVYIRANGKSYLAHRLAWYFAYGVMPSKMIDHINGVRNDNRICNLREATPSQNGYNMKMRNSNTSGVKGVHFHKPRRKWRAQCCLNNKNYHLGYFEKIEDAAAAVAIFRETNHKEFHNHGQAGGIK